MPQASSANEPSEGVSAKLVENVTDLADEQQRRGREPWRSKLIKNASKKPEKVFANALVPLREDKAWKGVLRYNTFSHVLELAKNPPWDKEPGEFQPRAWSDYDDAMLCEWMQGRGILISSGIASEAVQAIAYETPFHPVRNYLKSLKWDGVKRIDSWLAVYLGAEPSDYHTAIGSRWLISAIARIIKPGPNCKADCVLILEGEQGAQKSTALKTLAGVWFLDDMRKFSSRDAVMQLTGRWIVELAELTAMNEITIEACKAFLSQTMDSFRPPYGRRVIDAPRQCVFGASTNRDVFLKDVTGDRRSWPVATGVIDIAALTRDRDQLWAEAVVRYNQGDPWWLETMGLKKLAEEEQSTRFDADPWEFSISKYLKDKEETTPESVLENHFDREIKDVRKFERDRVSSILRRLEWKRVRLKTEERRDEYVWVPKEKHMRIQGLEK